MDSAFQYVIDKQISSTANYPYVARNQACQKKGDQYRIERFIDVAATENDVINALINRPVSVAVDASNWSPYKSGIFSNCAKNINHGVLLVGVAQDSFWLVKNSWGTTWGDNGYIRLAPGNTCAILSHVSYPVV